MHSNQIILVPRIQANRARGGFVDYNSCPKYELKSNVILADNFGYNFTAMLESLSILSINKEISGEILERISPNKNHEA